MMTMTRTEECSATTPCLLLAFELGERSWKLGFTIGLGQRPRIRSVPAGAMVRVWAEIADASGAGGAGEAGGVDGSTTITTPAMTMRGMIMGTAAYMSPEQAKGKAVDKRAFYDRDLRELLDGLNHYTATADGDRLLVRQPIGGAALSTVRVLVNWPAMLQK